MPAVQASFVREREVDDIPRQLAELRPQLEEREQALATTVAEIEESQKRHDALGASIETLRAQRAGAQTELAAAKGALASFRSRLHTMRANAIRMRDEITQLSAASEAAERERAAAETAGAAAATDEQSRRQTVVALESRRAALHDASGEQAATVAAHRR